MQCKLFELFFPIELQMAEPVASLSQDEVHSQDDHSQDEDQAHGPSAKPIELMAVLCKFRSAVMHRYSSAEVFLQELDRLEWGTVFDEIGLDHEDFNLWTLIRCIHAIGAWSRFGLEAAPTENQYPDKMDIRIALAAGAPRKDFSRIRTSFLMLQCEGFAPLASTYQAKNALEGLCQVLDSNGQTVLSKERFRELCAILDIRPKDADSFRQAMTAEECANVVDLLDPGRTPGIRDVPCGAAEATSRLFYHWYLKGKTKRMIRDTKDLTVEHMQRVIPTATPENCAALLEEWTGVTSRAVRPRSFEEKKQLKWWWTKKDIMPLLDASRVGPVSRGVLRQHLMRYAMRSAGDLVLLDGAQYSAGDTIWVRYSLQQAYWETTGAELRQKRGTETVSEPDGLPIADPILRTQYLFIAIVPTRVYWHNTSGGGFIEVKPDGQPVGEAPENYVGDASAVAVNPKRKQGCFGLAAPRRPDEYYITLYKCVMDTEKGGVSTAYGNPLGVPAICRVLPAPPPDPPDPADVPPAFRPPPASPTDPAEDTGASEPMTPASTPAPLPLVRDPPQPPRAVDQGTQTEAVLPTQGAHTQTDAPSPARGRSMQTEAPPPVSDRETQTAAPSPAGRQTQTDPPAPAVDGGAQTDNLAPGLHAHTQTDSGSPGLHAHTQTDSGSPGLHAHTQTDSGSPGLHAHTQTDSGSPGLHAHTQTNTAAPGRDANSQTNIAARDANTQTDLGSPGLHAQTQTDTAAPVLHGQTQTDPPASGLHAETQTDTPASGRDRQTQTAPREAVHELTQTDTAPAARDMRTQTDAPPVVDAQTQIALPAVAAPPPYLCVMGQEEQGRVLLMTEESAITLTIALQFSVSMPPVPPVSILNVP